MVYDEWTMLYIAWKVHKYILYTLKMWKYNKISHKTSNKLKNTRLKTSNKLKNTRLMTCFLSFH